MCVLCVCMCVCVYVCVCANGMHDGVNRTLAHTMYTVPLSYTLTLVPDPYTYHGSIDPHICAVICRVYQLDLVT